MPTLDPGRYIIYNPSLKVYLGIADGGLVVQGYGAPEKAQVWDITKDQIRTILVNGQIHLPLKYGSVSDGSHEMTINPAAGTAGPWRFDSVSGNIWQIVYASGPNWRIITGPLSGSPPTAKTVRMVNNANPGTPGHWSFLPSSSWQWGWSSGTINPFLVKSEELQKITEEMLTTFQENLKQSRPSFMIPTYVRRIPDGTEMGSFLGLTMADNLSISHFEFDGVGTIVTRNQKTFGLTLEQGDEGTEFFDYIARCIAQMVKKWDVDGTPEKPRYMGITFPYPVEKTAINTGKLLRWTKEASSSLTPGGTVGQDVVVLLQRALGNKQLGVNVKCNALINDTTATLLAQAYNSGRCEIGAIFDSGTNGAYVEATEKVASLKGKVDQPEMVLNTEWGGFTSNNLQRTQFDYHIDRESAYPGKRVFENFVSAASVGELARLVLLYIIDSDAPCLATNHRPLFNRRSSGKLNARGAIDIKLLRAIDATKNTSAVQGFLVKSLDLPREDVTEDDAKQVKDVCRAVLRRAARLSACTIAATLVLMGRAKLGGGVELDGNIDIGIASSLTIPAFKLDMEEALRDLISETTAKNVSIVTVDLKGACDLGAALCACLESEDKNDSSGQCPDGL